VWPPPTPRPEESIHPPAPRLAQLPKPLPLLRCEDLFDPSLGGIEQISQLRLHLTAECFCLLPPAPEDFVDLPPLLCGQVEMPVQPIYRGSTHKTRRAIGTAKHLGIEEMGADDSNRHPDDEYGHHRE
jgi:hypothetical protein